MMAASIPGTIAAFAVILLAGMGLVRLLAGADLAKTPRLEQYGLGLLLGSAYISIALFVISFALHGRALIAAVSTGAAALFWWSRRIAAPQRASEPYRTAEWIVLALFVGQAVFIAWWTPKVALGWDALVLWEAKGRAAFLFGGGLPVNYLNDPPFGSAAMPLYPLYLPYLQDWLYLWIGRADQAWVRIFGPFSYVIAVLILAGAAQRLGVSRLGGLIAAAAFFFVPYCFTGQWDVLSGYSDFPLGVFYLAAASRLPHFAEAPSSADLRFFAVLAGLVPWTKQEGLFLWLILVGIAGLVLIRRRQWKVAFAVAIPGVIIAGGFKIFLKAIGAPSDPFYHPPTLENFRTYSDRILPVIQGIGAEFFLFESWSLLWIGAGAALLLMAIRRQWHLAFTLGLAICVPLAFFVLPFVLSALESYKAHMEVAVPRLLLQIAPTAMLAIALACPRSLMQRTE